MAEKLQPIRGTHDILPLSFGGEFEHFHTVVTLARDLAVLYGFKEISTPIFEMTDVFSRSMGETSDVVSKEMFTFDTRGGESVTLRPEFTAGISRAFISNGLQQHLPLKLFSTGPVFRYERPQKGRQRQFHQVNFEWIGDASVEADAEAILLAGHIIYTLAGNKGCTLLINTLGDIESRTTYRDALVNYLTPHTASLSEDSQRRLVANPLRILDSKSEQDKAITANAPKITDYLSAASKDRFEKLCALLKDSHFIAKLEISSSLVRGLDYYTDTVFEFVAETGELGAQNTVLAGGRYDGLVEQMGGKPTPSVGFAAGVERLMLLAGASALTPPKLKINIIPFEEIVPKATFELAGNLRVQLQHLLNKTHLRVPCTVEIAWQGSVKKRMERAAKNEATHVVIVSPDEMSRGTCLIKTMKTGAQEEVPLAELIDGIALQKRFFTSYE